MLSENTVVMTRKAIESMYNGTCTVIEYQEYIKENKSTGHCEVVVLEGQPCRLSFSSSPQTNPQNNKASTIEQMVKVFIAPELTIKAGSKLIITQNGVTTTYVHSGKSAMYPTHQEIVLDLWERWS